MDKTVEELRRRIAECSVSGRISQSDRISLLKEAEEAGLSEADLEVLIRSVTLVQQPEDDAGTRKFVPKTIHIVVALLVIVLLSVFIFVSLDLGGARSGDTVIESQRSRPITQDDLAHIYSGNYDGKSILVTVKEVSAKGTAVVMTYDLKCDFMPVAAGCKCQVDLAGCKYSFDDNEAVRRKVPLGSGTIERTSAGKLVFKSSSGLYQLIQL